MFGKRQPLSESATNALVNYLLPQAGASARRSGRTVGAETANIAAARIASGDVERAGPFVWFNGKPTDRLSHFLALPDERVDEAVTKLADQQLRHAGFADGASGKSYTVLRILNPERKPELYIMAYPHEGGMHTDIHLPYDMIQAAARQLAREQVEANQPKPVFPTSTAASRAKSDYDTKHAMDPKGRPTIELLDADPKAFAHGGFGNRK